MLEKLYFLHILMYIYILCIDYYIRSCYILCKRIGCIHVFRLGRQNARSDWNTVRTLWAHGHVKFQRYIYICICICLYIYMYIICPFYFTLIISLFMYPSVILYSTSLYYDIHVYIYVVYTGMHVYMYA